MSFFAVSAAFLMPAAGCAKYETPENIKKPKPEEAAVYNVVAHRGGYVESGLPDCSIAGLKYSIALGCKYSECDIVITKDQDVLVVHPARVGNNDVVNGVIPSEKTTAEIRALGKLKNGEDIPTLREYIQFLQNKTNNPIGHTVWMDVKEVMVNGTVNYQLSINACLRAAAIVKEMKAENLMEFIVPSGSGIYPHVRDKVINEYKMNIAWMTASEPKDYNGGWAQLRWDKVIGDSRAVNPELFFEQNVPLSIYYTVGTAAEDSEIGDKVIPYYPKLKAIFTNWPKQTIEKIKKAGY